MINSKYICFNGEFLNSSQSCINADNRTFISGELIFENIHAYATQAQFLSLHLERLKENMTLLSFKEEPFFNVKNISELITRLLNKNRIFTGALIRLIIFRKDDKERNVNFIIVSSELDYGKYNLNEKGIYVDICESYIKTTGALSNFYPANWAVYHMAKLESKNNNLDDVILLNEYGRIVETASSNLFLVSGNSLFTPGLKQGCINGIMRKIIIDLAIDAQFTVNEQSSLSPAALNDAEEVFLTNSIEGIRWVVGYKQTRYFKKTARLLLNKLNELAFNTES